jgi:broad specificity phosphatase PhoE
MMGDNMNTRILFVRHAEAEGNFKREFHGWTDSVITPKGHLQAQKIADRLIEEQIDVIYSSSLTRTMQTAKYISDIKGLSIIKTDKLKEINGGDWEARPWDELPAKWKDEYDTWENQPHIHKMPNGETMQEFSDRLVKEVEKIVSENEGKNICIVTHGTAIRVLMCHFHDVEFCKLIEIAWQDNTALTIIEKEGLSYKVILEGDNSHLGAELSTIQNQKWWEEYKKKFDKSKS